MSMTEKIDNIVKAQIILYYYFIILNDPQFLSKIHDISKHINWYSIVPTNPLHNT